MRKPKKLLSLLTAVALCVSYMMPTAALAAAGEGAGEGITSAIQQVTVQSNENSIAVQSAADAVAEVTIGVTTTQYDNIDKAFEAAQNADSATMKLLQDITTTAAITVSSGNIMLDLNNKIVTGQALPGALITIDGGSLTIENSGFLSGSRHGIQVNNGTLIVKNGNISGNRPYGSEAYPALYVTGGTVQLCGGHFFDYNATCPIWMESGTPESLLAEGYGFFQDEDGKTPSFYDETGCGVLGNNGETWVKQKPKDAVYYVDADGNAGTRFDCIELTDRGFTGVNYDGTYWFVAKENVTLADVLSAHGTINLILCDGATVTASKGITLESNETQPATLNVYAQSAGTGKLVATGASSSAVMTAGIRNANNSVGEATLNIYGGTIEATGAKCAVFPGEDDYSGAGIGTYVNDKSANILNVNIYGGVVIAQSGGKDGAAIGNGQGSNGTVNVTIAGGMKCVKTNNLIAKAEYGNTDGASVTITKCVDHQWGYTQNADGDTHAATCKLCGKAEAAKSHSYANWKADEGGVTHTGTCVCGATSTVDHTLAYHLSADKKSHYGECNECGYKSAVEVHNDSGENGSCSICGAPADVAEEKIEVVMTKYDGTVVTTDYMDLLEGFEAADKSEFKKVEVKLLQSGKTYTLDSPEAFPIEFEYTYLVEVIVDLNGCTLKRSVTDDTHGILKVEKGNVTFKNGTLELKNDSSSQAIDLTNTSEDNPTLTLENMTVNATGGYAINAAGKDTLYIKSGNYSDVLINDNFATAQLHGGSYGSVVCYNGYAKLLETGYIFARQSDSSYIDPNMMGPNTETSAWENIENIKVIACQHEGGYTDGKCSRCGYECEHENVGDDYKCTTCGTQMTAKVGKDNYFATLATAIEAAKNNGTVTLLADVEENITIANDMTVIIDLNEKTWRGFGTGWSGYQPVPLTVNGGSVTVKNGTLNQGGASSNANTAVIVNGGSLTVDAGMTIRGGTYDFSTVLPAITVESGSLTLSVGTELYGGMKVPKDGTLADYLPENTAFAKDDGGVINGHVQFYVNAETLTVMQHTHNFDKDSKCACGAEIAAQVGNSYYTTPEAAIEAANGETVTLLKDISGTLTVSVPAKLDGNGHTIEKLAVSGNVALESLLPEGYAFKSGTNWICSLDGKNELSDVTIALAPVKSVTANNPTIKVKYGDSYTLSTTFAWTGDSNSSARIKWEYASGGYIHEQAPTLTGCENNSRTMDYTFSPTGRYPAQIGTCTYVVTFTKDGYSKSCEFTVTIEKGNATVTKAPVAVGGLTYTGDTQELVTAGAASGGKAPKMQYSLDGTSWQTEIPTGTNAGEYIVWYKAVGDSTYDNYYDSQPQSIEVTVAQADPTCVAPTGATATYGQKLNDIALTNPKGNTPGTWAWADGEQNVGNVGNNTFKATFTPEDTKNYKTVENIDVTVTVNKADGGVTVPIAKTLTYNGKDQALVEAAVSETGTVQYKLGNGEWSENIPTAMDAGDYTVYYKVVGDKNHNDVDEASVTVTIAPAQVTVAVKDKNINVGDAAPSLGAPVLDRDYTVAGLIDSDKLTTEPTLKYADVNGNDVTPDTNKAGEAAKIVASGASAGNNYTISYTPGKLTVSVPYTPSPTPTPTPDPKPNPEPDQPSDPSTPDTPQAPSKGDTVTTGTGSAQLGFTVTGVADASGKGGTVAFTGCPKSAKKVSIPATVEINSVAYAVTEVALNAFKGRKELKKVVIPDFILKIGKGAFQGCKNLESVTLGTGLKSIGKNAFEGCKNLRTIVITSKQLSKNSIKDCLKGSKVEKIIVQVGSKKENKKTAKKYAKIFTKKIAGKKVSVKARKKPLKK